MTIKASNETDILTRTLSSKIDILAWTKVEEDLDARGYAVIDGLLDEKTCKSLSGLYKDDQYFRKQVIMGQHGYGLGEYKYFGYPLPEPVRTLRTSIFPKLVNVANRWNENLKKDQRFPQNHTEYLETCHRAGQTRPTPLILRYEAGDYNCLHQDLYGDHVFPLQTAILLSKPDVDFKGGEFILTEQKPRMQAKPMVVPLQQGSAVIFAVNHRPVQGKRGHYRVTMKHGVSTLHTGERFTLGIIFHDAK